MNNIIRQTQVSEADFLKQEGLSKIPFVLENYAENWEASKKWSPDFFKNMYGNLQVKVISCLDNSIREMSLADYFDYFNSNPDDAHLYYLKNWLFENDIPELTSDYEIPCFFESWTEKISEEQKPQLRWLYIGPKGSGSHLHLDVVNSSAWNAVISGKKIWHFYPPDQIGYLYDMHVDSFNPDLEKYPLFINAKPIVCIQKQGDVVFTPSGWPHQVMNLESCISVTENFINESNYADVLSYLKAEKRDTEVALLQDLKNALGK